MHIDARPSRRLRLLSRPSECAQIDPSDSRCREMILLRGREQHHSASASPGARSRPEGQALVAGFEWWALSLRTQTKPTLFRGRCRVFTYPAGAQNLSPWMRPWLEKAEESGCLPFHGRPSMSLVAAKSPAPRGFLWMARPGLEPGTPRFSVVCSTN